MSEPPVVDEPAMPEVPYNPITPAITDVYSQALAIANNKYGNGFQFIKDSFITGLAAQEGFTTEQKTGIMLVAEKLQRRKGGPLLGILDFKWSEIPGYDEDTLTPLQPAERNAILQGVLNVCRVIITAEAQRLNAVADQETPLDADWYEKLNPTPVV